MRLLVLLGIRAYQSLPDRLKRKCVFRETCSRHVARTVRERGVVAGVLAFRIRMRRCRPVRAMTMGPDGEWEVTLADGSVVGVEELVPGAYETYGAAANAVIRRLASGETSQ